MKKTAILFLLLTLLPLTASAQLSAYHDRALAPVTVLGIPSPVMAPIAYGQVRVCNTPAANSPCTPIASIFDLNGNALSVVGGNFGQLTTDVTGQFSFQCNPGTYQVQVAASASNTPQLTYVVSCPTNVAGPNLVIPGNLNVAGTATFTGALNATGPNTLANLNSTLYVTSAGTDGCAAIQTQINALPTISGFHSGVVDFTALASASQPVPCLTTVSAGSPYLWLRGPGAAALTFSCSVNGDCFNTQTTGGAGSGSAGFRMSGFSIKGTGTANGVGLHAGDMVGGRFEDLSIDGFTGANGAGIWFENKNFFFEDNIFVNVFSGQSPSGSQLGNTKDFRWSVTTASSANASFQYNRYWWLKYSTLANQTTLSFEGGVHAGSEWHISGNTTSATGTTFLAISGSTFPTSGINTIVAGNWYVKNECTLCSGAAFYSIPSGYTMTIESGSIATNSGFTYTVAGALQQVINFSPLATPILQAYDASGNRLNNYQFIANNPASNRAVTFADYGLNTQIQMATVPGGNPLIAAPLQNIAGTAFMGLTLKKGSGAGNYTNATTSYTVADSTNLCFTVTIPTGWKLGVSASGALSTATAAVVAQAALTDNAACSTANTGILVETAPIQGAGIGIADAFALDWVITGDGAAHNIALQFKTSNVADTASLINSSATIIPTMKFELMPSN